MLTQRSQVLEESITLAITALANELKAKGEDVISFSAGEPDFDTPQTIKNAAIAAIEKGCGKYTPVAGINEVLKAVQSKLKNDNQLDYQTNEIITNVGAKHSLFECIECLIQKDDEVIIPTPYWVSYPEMVKFAGGKPIFIEALEENGFKITPKQLQNAITNKTKMLILNSPSNPVGSIYSKEEFIQLAKILENTNITVLSDEMYEKLRYDNINFTAFASVSEDALKRTVTINGLSKCGAMPGWRFGYMASKNKALISAVKRLQGQSTSNICAITQYAAIPALTGICDEDIEKMRQAFEKRRNLALDFLAKIPNISVYKPQGAFYLFINIQKIEKNSMRFCQKLLEQEKVAVVPGIGFGMDGYFRLSYATSDELIKKGLERISRFIINYKQ
ncbi:pyridoxal phosphate-dependent aminotransferase [Campylobacter sp. VicNov18]|uniref:pyridoxal phosphate-dependent aminotransferase n=1 Tax=Campylobacter bilis TaxID=2691918 RepID=UPI00130DCBAE|nr:pyridoxal phosphate-dependent aminotransferase [Campylobacter bilis]MPV63619.1 aminotransferase class I/II-fold pyridoxal phosphate-dependent enzyme [Campylobacter hepaticus]MBM0637119.1 aminotransferase class I/II-fold pyridoxal phosphate-dependent enzyme [Campylobacter bilis]MCC8277722.1 pyridoxal phosphate-dependent aminotransferase [Campylobacter bilis]MCC8299331.1 pyridoxal phosphate-dependent aminotransferase [Campylobacter bilis]MCC8300631.1 pyridoxal phosphate-dependent aminotransfe